MNIIPISMFKDTAEGMDDHRLYVGIHPLTGEHITLTGLEWKASFFNNELGVLVTLDRKDRNAQDNVIAKIDGKHVH